MKTASLLDNITYNDTKPVISVLLNTNFTKEIRIVFKKGQLMKEHQAPFPIIVQVIDGEITFGAQGVNHFLSKGMLIALDAAVPHNLIAEKDSIIRLTLSKFDDEKRVKNL